jgi:hypothetical protein
MHSIESLKARKQRLMQNGKNLEGQGVLRKLDRKIRNLEKKNS